ncbi:MAG: hypothetical protein OEY59_07025, partial [Deltaproteobacteria bacterium]|nr:hypothetical protein [Deltaproteobacteria bacterium]
TDFNLDFNVKYNSSLDVFTAPFDLEYDHSFSVSSSTDYQRLQVTLTLAATSPTTSYPISNGLTVRLIFKRRNTTGTLNFKLAAPQLELGPVATDFEIVPEADDLIRVQRYIETSYTAGDYPGKITELGGYRIHKPTSDPFPVNIRWQKKRVLPTITIYSPTVSTPGKIYNETTGNKNAPSPDKTGDQGCSIELNSTDFPIASKARFHVVIDSGLF